MNWTRLLLGRIGGLLLTLFLSSVVIFSALLLTPGDPIAALAGGAKPTPELVAQIRAEYHLDDPIWMRYLQWLSGVFTGDFGRSFVYKTDVMTLIAPRFGITLQLVLLTVLIILVAGVGSGILAATRGPGVDRAVGILTALGMALPGFVVAILLIWIFAKSLGWFPVYGEGAPGWDRVWHLILPAVSLAVMFIAYVSRVTRSAIVAQMHAEHVDTARVRGIPRARIFGVHVFRNAAPQILAISGTTIAGLFAASAIVEVAFGVGGIGSLLTEAAARKDLPVVQLVSLILVAVFVVLNAIADLIGALIDPDTVTAGRQA
ncbi:ABC transporter permease [Leucobacter triazinivorans]|uniref:ABC transporter permease n=1 Tax=Leucobacter triazinivorans TaxID=1784719 RepID=A0A4P6KH45_9MICO|nr:ABC transporter permease [Leucobacter triazinivorans]QBE49766.1 ABC transporter permease [Leucobacter triazinivorans]